MSLVSVNPTDSHWTRHTYILWFGAYGDTKLLLWANSLDDALDEAVDWLAENEPGQLCDNAVFEAYKESLAGGMSEEEAQEWAAQDTTQAGNYGNYILSHEWGIVAEDPDRETILELQERIVRKNIQDVLVAFRARRPLHFGSKSATCSTDGVRVFSYALEIATWVTPDDGGPSYVSVIDPDGRSNTTRGQIRAAKFFFSYPRCYLHQDCAACPEMGEACAHKHDHKPAGTL